MTLLESRAERRAVCAICEWGMEVGAVCCAAAQGRLSGSQQQQQSVQQQFCKQSTEGVTLPGCFRAACLLAGCRHAQQPHQFAEEERWRRLHDCATVPCVLCDRIGASSAPYVPSSASRRYFVNQVFSLCKARQQSNGG